MASIAYEPRAIAVKIPRRRLDRRIVERMLMVSAALLVLALIWQIGPIMYREHVGWDIIKNHSHVLKFTVAGHEYTVVTPAIPLSDFQREAYFEYAKKYGYPTYAADGPLAIDP